jgi:acetyl esterase
MTFRAGPPAGGIAARMPPVGSGGMRPNPLPADPDAAAAPVLEPATARWLAGLAAAGAPPVYQLSPRDARRSLHDVQDSVPVELAPAQITDRVIPGGPAGEVSVRIVRPAGVTGALPLLLHCHGGGWILGDKVTFDRLDRELARAAQAVVVFVDYTPAPEAHYPVQLEQASAALEWAAANAAQLGADPARIAVIGDSAGGSLAAAVMLLAAGRGPAITAQVLAYPVTDADFDTPSYQRYAGGPWLTRAAMRWFWDAYLPDQDRRREVTAAPLRASPEQLAGLPPALVINGEHDVLRSEGEAYAGRLSQAGVPVTQVRYGGTIHDFLLLNPIAATPAPRAAISQIGSYLRDALR